MENKKTAEIIAEQYKKLPKEVQDAITASDFPGKLKTIANKHSLMLDQSGALQNEVLFVLLGMEPSSDFIENISRELSIDKEKSVLITKDVNEAVFKSVRKYLREWEEKAEKEAGETTENISLEKNDENKAVSDLEKIGGFDIEPKQGSDDQGIDHIESRDRLINSIENPPAVEIDTTTGTQHNTEPFVDHLLAGPVVTVEQKTVQTAPQKASSPITSKIPTKPSTSDLYREPIE